MKSTYLGFRATELSPTSELLGSLHASKSDIGDQHLLAYTPVARVNPYQALCYKQFPNEGILAAPVLQPAKFLDLQNLSLRPLTKTLHLHWNSWMTQGMEDPERARMMGMGMAGRLQRLQKFGFNIVWTVHNVYPHDAMHVHVELEIQQRIADTADVLHVMSGATADAMSGITEIDSSKILVSPHPSYKGAYPDYVSREDARAALGIHGDEIVFLVFGALKAYKGLSRTLDAFDHLVAKNPMQRFRIIFAGKADNSDEVQEFITRANVHPRVLIEDSNIPTDKVQYFMRASDVGVVHYARSLNSGAALLYGAFDLPIVASATPTFLAELNSESTIFVEDETVASLADSMMESIDLIGSKAALAAISAEQKRLSADKVSSQFAQDLLIRLK
ncbi:glycosyltransferase [Glutamicibacter sp. NPDC127525]|uniref:glycosyltransferase n=1 Tax=unclassified Glutamicibacter TaxID=2627139 RepID=UPI00363BF276